MTMFAPDAVKAELSPVTADRTDIITKEITGSTNTDIKELAAKGAPEGTVIIAGGQTAGRGRLGRSFYSPQHQGLYLSLLLRPKLGIADALSITACAALAAAEAIESVCGCSAGIKWVNDIYVDGKKVCGILTESALSSGGEMSYAVLGIGINLSETEFPVELREKAGSLGISPQLRPKLAADLIERFFGYYDALPQKLYLEEYRKRSILTGKTVEYKMGGIVHTALVLGISDDNTLIVSDEKGCELHLNSGEISVIMK